MGEERLHDVSISSLLSPSELSVQRYGAAVEVVRRLKTEDRISVFEEDDYTCIYCGKKTDDPHCDHIIPKIIGGTDDRDNLATACKRCNLQKGGYTLTNWMKTQIERSKGIPRSEIFSLHEKRKREALKNGRKITGERIE